MNSFHLGHNSALPFPSELTISRWRKREDAWPCSTWHSFCLLLFILSGKLRSLAHSCWKNTLRIATSTTVPNRSLTSSSWQVPTYRASPQKSCDQREPFPSEVPGNGTLVSIHVLCSAHCLLTWRYFSLLRFSFSFTISTSHLVFSAQFITLLIYGWKTDQ